VLQEEGENMIWFKVVEARDFLLRNGFVFTIRPNWKREGIHKIRMRKENDDLHGWLWLMKELDMTTPDIKEQLEPYVEYSGFKSAEDWIGHIPKPSKTMYLYFMRMIPNEV